MSENQFTWPFDPTGTKPENKVVGEMQVISPPQHSDFYFIIPKAAPFYKDTLKLFFRDAAGIRTEMIEGKDWIPTHYFIGGSRSTTKPVYGSITFINKTIKGVVELAEYQCVGGEWTIDEDKAMWIVANTKSNPRITTWEEIDERPNRFPPTDHEWHLDDLVGMKEVVETMEKMVDAIYARNSDDLANHIGDRDNPHQVTKDQVGLGLVQNLSLATQQEAIFGTAHDRYMTPLRVKQAIDSQIGDAYRQHEVNYENPHRVTKTQVGLGLVENFRIASLPEALQGTANNLYMTPLATKHLIDNGIRMDLNNHVGDLNNPHEVTKEQVGLGLVANYRVATDQEAAAAAATNLYLTPANGRKLVESVAGAMLDEHLLDYTNPHRVTKAQVGLSLVQNFQIATEEEAVAGELDIRYMTPLKVKQAIDKQAGDMIRAHVDDKTNPHQVTKAQVGLGSVQDYGIATQPEAETGVLNTKYMTPLRVKNVVDKYNTDIVQPHVTNYNNPHRVTKAQVGLTSVEDYGIATTPEAQQGTVNNKYMTPLRTKEAIDAQVGNDFRAHAANRNNPHGVSPGQIGAYTSGQVDGLVNQLRNDLVGLHNSHAGNFNNPHQTNKWHIGLGSLNDWPAANAWDIGNGTGGRYVPADALKQYLQSLGIGDGSGGLENYGSGQRGFARIGPILICFGWQQTQSNNQVTSFMRTFSGRPSVVAQAHDVSNGSPSRSLQTVDGVNSGAFRFRWDGIGVQGWSYIAIGLPG